MSPAEPASTPDASERPSPVRTKRGGVLGIAMLMIAVLCWWPVPILVWPGRPYALDLLSHFALHGAALAALVSFGAVLIRRQIAASVAIVAAAATLVLALPKYHGPVAPSGAATAQQRIKILHFNIKSASPSEGDAVYQWIESENPDIVCILEGYGSFFTASQFLRDNYPYRIEPKSGMAWPAIIASRLPFQETALAPFSGEIQGSLLARRSALVELPGGGRFLMALTHPVSPRRPVDWRASLDSVALEARVLREWMQRDENRGVPVVVSGDFNSSPTGRVSLDFARLSGLKGWSPWWNGGTWPSIVPTWLAIPIDRVWSTPDVRCVSYRVGPRFQTAAKIARPGPAKPDDPLWEGETSDHRPIVVELEIPRAP